MAFSTVLSSIQIAVVTASLLGLCACDMAVQQATGPVEHYKKTLELDKSETARFNLKMGVGEMRMHGGSDNLMDADFAYNVPSWKPEVRYDAGASQSQVTIEQPSGTKNMHGNAHYEWDIRLNDQKPVSLALNFGAGKAVLDLGSLTIQSLTVEMGVGELDLNLRGKPKKDYDVTIQGGVGKATVQLPRDVAIVADVEGGLGSINTKGLHKRGSRYVNDAFEANPKTTIRLQIHGGIGEISLDAE